MFGIVDKDIEALHTDLILSMDGTEKCVTQPDLFTENYTNRPIPKALAEALCAGCPVLDKCRDYAIKAQEPYYIWGGTRPQDRTGIAPK